MKAIQNVAWSLKLGLARSSAFFWIFFTCESDKFCGEPQSLDRQPSQMAIRWQNPPFGSMKQARMINSSGLKWNLVRGHKTSIFNHRRKQNFVPNERPPSCSENIDRLDDSTASRNSRNAFLEDETIKFSQALSDAEFAAVNRRRGAMIGNAFHAFNEGPTVLWHEQTLHGSCPIQRGFILAGAGWPQYLPVIAKVWHIWSWINFTADCIRLIHKLSFSCIYTQKEKHQLLA